VKGRADTFMGKHWIVKRDVLPEGGH